ncbi:hypothetical protein KQI74_13820 [Paenibacillus barcinonensis]|uniref:hypothetical protein n=1 Tax=Paenibacillus barcinonensis TaxID=198119 RepID=UPI001C125615|nr:hypothetical protein [Paenibacillus barcinonensis]MBU5353369.1 hypothetical protein [Paenibacillus barcinonensis]
MLLGREFTILSQMSLHYRRHEDGCYRCSIKNFKGNFDENSMKYIKRLEEIGIVKIDRELIIVNTLEWIKLFLIKINLLLKSIDNKVECKYKDKNSVDILYNDKLISTFWLNFNIEGIGEMGDETCENVIHFCELYLQQENGLYWFDLLNDISLLEHFYFFIMKKFSSFSYSNIRNFDFLTSIDESYISHIFHIVIPDFLGSRGYILDRSVNNDHLQILKKYHHSDTINVLALKKAEENDMKDIFVIKIDKTISYLSIEDNEIRMYSNNDFDDLQRELLKKMNSFNTIMLINKQQTFTLAEKSMKYVWVFITLINSLLLYGNTKGVEGFKNITSSSILLYIVAGILLILTILTFVFYTLPSIKLSLFNWRIRRKKHK